MYRSIARDGRVELLVVFAVAGAAPIFDTGFGQIVKWQKDIVDGFSHVVVSATDAQRPRAVVDAISKFAPDIVYVHGYSLDYLRAATNWARRRGLSVLMTTDSELLHPRPWYIRAFKRILLPSTLSKIDLFLTVGDENERYFAHYGVKRSKFHRVTFSIDSSYYDNILAERDSVRTSIRRELGIPDDSVAILTVGKMIPRKCHEDLIRAFGDALHATRRRAVLLIAGDGPSRGQLEQLALPLGDAVKLLGFVGVEDLPKYYVAADIYAHPSSDDPHPLAISEALYCSLPVVVSDRVGSIGATDDVRVGSNGWVYPYGDRAALTAILIRLIEDGDLRKRAGQASRPLGKQHASDYCARTFVDGALIAHKSRETRQS
jgi:glycosyltransferase involved in cell wall biosynthesis